MTTAVPEELSFPRQQARTGRFSRGAPRAFTVSPDGTRVLFLRSSSGTDPMASLWSIDTSTGVETLVGDPRELLVGGDEELTREERARRERAREGGAGIVGYAVDEDVELAAFTLSGRLFVADLTTPGALRELPAVTPVADPRPSPDGSRVAYVAGGALRVIGVDGSDDTEVIAPDGPNVTWGLAEFVAAEEMQRSRGFWWASDSTRLLAARVDESPVHEWWFADPANPATEPAMHRYPAAGTPNADVSLAMLSFDGTRIDVQWDREVFEYVVTAGWPDRAPTVLVQTRNQRRTRLLVIDPTSGTTSVLQEDSDPSWVEIVPGVPAWSARRLVTVGDRSGWRRLLLDDESVTPDGMQVRAVRSVSDTGVLFTASTAPAEIQLWRCTPDGTLRQLTSAVGVHGGVESGGTLVRTTALLGETGFRTEVVVSDERDAPAAATITSYAERPVLTPAVELLRVTDRSIPVALLLPRDHDPAAGPLPVLMDPYGGPHGQRVVAAADAHLTSQWFADQGFAVVVVDGAGTPGRGHEVERAVAGDLTTPVLDDQVDALHALAAQRPELDLTRVGIRGWSFGGYLAAMAVLRRPDVFHAAVAGAPVIDVGLYDTHYMERYLGDPATSPDVYAHNSLIADAAGLERPLMLVHGLADDNVVVAHTLRMSSALLAAGKAHTVLPLSGVTHMTPQEAVAENLLLLQVDFLRRALG